MARGSVRRTSAGRPESSDLSVLVEGDADLGPAPTRAASGARSMPVAREPGAVPAGALGRGRRLERVGVGVLTGIALLSLVLVLRGELEPGRGSAGGSPLRVAARQLAAAPERPGTDRPAPAAGRVGGGSLAEAVVWGGGSTPPVESMGAWRALRMVVRAEHLRRAGGTVEPRRGSAGTAVRSGPEGGVAAAGPSGGVTLPGPPGAPAGRRVVLPAPVTAPWRQIALPVALTPGSRLVTPSPRIAERLPGTRQT